MRFRTCFVCLLVFTLAPHTMASMSSSPLLSMEALLNEWLWQEEYWIPPGIHWQDIQMKEDEGRIPLPRDLIYTLPMTLVFIALRYVFER